MSQINKHNGKLVKIFPTLKHCGDNYSYNVRSSAKKFFEMTLPLLNRETFGR